ncbi:MAG: bactofilin family protein [Saprospiraceae bacterium]
MSIVNNNSGKVSTGNSMPGADSGLTCVIAEGTVIEGTFICSENVRLDGKINGEVKVDKKLVMGPSGVIDGTINAMNTAIQGKIEGDISVTEALQLFSTAQINGNINAGSISVEEGAVYNGKISVAGKKK